MDIYEVAEPIIKRAAAKVARNWPGINADDAAQEMWVKVTENASSIHELDAEDAENLIGGLARMAGTAYAVRERQYFQHQNAEWIYTPAEVRILLSDYFHGEMHLDPPKRPEGSNQTLMGDGGSIPMMDLSTAFEDVSEADQVILIRRYDAGEKLDAAERKRVERAVDRLTDAMNGSVYDRFDHYDHEGPGARTAISNAQARVMTDNDWNY